MAQAYHTPEPQDFFKILKQLYGIHATEFDRLCGLVVRVLGY
jgi:hypothetical protein